MRYSEIMETWTNRFKSANIISKFPGKFVHFTNTPKLGVNPLHSISHNDPRGIYFYPVNWILQQEFSYAVNFKYFYIVDIDMTNILNLRTMTRVEMFNLADANGWLPQLKNMIQNFDFYFKNDENPMWNNFPALLETPGGIFYSAMDWLANVGLPQGNGFTWQKMLKTVDGLYDPGYGYINRNEPQQIVVMKRSVIKILHFGDNTGVNIGYEVAKNFARLVPGTTIKMKQSVLTIQYNGSLIKLIPLGGGGPQMKFDYDPTTLSMFSVTKNNKTSWYDFPLPNPTTEEMAIIIKEKLNEI